MVAFDIALPTANAAERTDSGLAPQQSSPPPIRQSRAHADGRSGETFIRTCTIELHSRSAPCYPCLPPPLLFSVSGAWSSAARSPATVCVRTGRLLYAPRCQHSYRCCSLFWGGGLGFPPVRFELVAKMIGPQSLLRELRGVQSDEP
jgi:hypothetical protein